MILFSCKNKLAHKVAEHETLKTQIMDSWTSAYQISYCWDTLDAHNRRSLYTVDLGPVIMTQYQLIGKTRISDIYEEDSVTKVSIVAGTYRSFHFSFPVDKHQQDELTQKDKDFILLVSISEIKKSNSTDFIGEGKIIKVISIDKLDSEIIP